ncbi:uncharacterized protein [Coffea arabica]|uniref:Tf2-1-like SH3-like domain-containing protein n=1 Tax=Coffea arabica TaxID=13443 RepID=A0ABM4UR12_COFAR
MAPYKALYGRKCRSPIYWDEVGERRILDPTIIPWIEDAQEKVKLIRQRLQTAQSRQKSYADNRRKDLEFEVGDQVFLKITPLRSLTAGKGKKLQPRFVGPFPILQRVGKVAYRLELPSSLSRIHDVFHVSMLKRYYPDPAHIVQPEEIEIDEALTYEEKPVQVLDRKVKELRNKQIPLVKILWKNHGVEEATWEMESEMKTKYPELFSDSAFQRRNNTQGLQLRIDVASPENEVDKWCVTILFERDIKWLSQPGNAAYVRYKQLISCYNLLTRLYRDHCLVDYNCNNI